MIGPSQNHFESEYNVALDSKHKTWEFTEMLKTQALRVQQPGALGLGGRPKGPAMGHR